MPSLNPDRIHAYDTRAEPSDPIEELLADAVSTVDRTEAADADVTTARARQADFKKVEGRFRFKQSLTTENIEQVLEDRLFKKNVSGKQEVVTAYRANPGVLRDLGELKNSSQKLPPCNEEKFTSVYPFLPYQIHLIPEVVKSLRSAGGRGEQLIVWHTRP